MTLSDCKHNIKIEASNYDDFQVTEKTQLTDLQNSRLSAIETLYNPWLSKYHNHKDNDTSKITSEDVVIKLAADTGCTIRRFNNVTMYSSTDFIHEYIDYKTCLKQTKGWLQTVWEIYKVGNVVLMLNDEKCEGWICFMLKI